MAQTRKTDVAVPGLTSKEHAGKTPVLELHTGKGFRGGGIQSSATMFWSDGQYRSTMLFGDFSWHPRHTPGTATQKAIDRQHAEVFSPDAVARIVGEARAYYAKRDGTEEEETGSSGYAEAAFLDSLDPRTAAMVG